MTKKNKKNMWIIIAVVVAIILFLYLRSKKSSTANKEAVSPYEQKVNSTGGFLDSGIVADFVNTALPVEEKPNNTQAVNNNQVTESNIIPVPVKNGIIELNSTNTVYADVLTSSRERKAFKI